MYTDESMWSLVLSVMTIECESFICHHWNRQRYKNVFNLDGDPFTSDSDEDEPVGEGDSCTVATCIYKIIFMLLQCSNNH